MKFFPIHQALLVGVMLTLGAVAASAQGTVSGDTLYQYQNSAGNFSTGFSPQLASGGSANTQLLFGGTADYAVNDNFGATTNLNAITFSNTGLTTVNSAPSDMLNFMANTLGILPSLFLGNGSGGATIAPNISLGAATTFTNTGIGTLTFQGNLSAGGNLVVIAGSGSTFFASGASLNSTGGGLTKTGSGKLTFTGGSTANADSLGSGTLTVNGGIVNFDSPDGSVTNFFDPAANLALGGGALLYTNENTSGAAANQGFAGLTLTAGESVLYVNQSNAAPYTTLTIPGTPARTIGATLTVRPNKGSTMTYGATIFSGIAQTNLVTSNGTAYLTAGNVYSGTQGDNFNDWAAIDSVRRVIAPLYTGTSSTSLGTLAQNANVAAATTTLQANATDQSFRDAVNQATTIDLAGHTWQTGGILVTSAVATTGSIIKDSVGTGSLTGPSNSDLTIFVSFVSANPTTPVPFTISANIVNNGTSAITKGAPGTLILSGSNTFTGGVYINDGTIQLGSAGALNATTPNAINFDGSGLIAGTGNTNPGTLATPPTLALAGNSVAVASISTANNQSGVTPIIENANGASVGNAVLTVSGATSTTFGGIVQDGAGGGTLGLTLTGGGTLTLTNTNTYTGLTAINAGTLVVNGSLAAGSAVTVGGSAATGPSTLTGAGTVSGTVLLSSAGSTGAAGTLNPGGVGTVGTLATGAETFQIGSTVVFDFTNTAMDALLVNGAVSGINTATFSFNALSGATLSGPSYTLLTATSDMSANPLPVTTGRPSGYSLQYANGGTQIVLASAPEPSQWMAFGLGMLGLSGLICRPWQRTTLHGLSVRFRLRGSQRGDMPAQ